ncbi:hypothetical protein FKM82_020125 [Ascaphus truei]
MSVPSALEVRKWAQRRGIPLNRVFALGHVPATISLGTVTEQVRKLPLLDNAQVQDHFYDHDQTWRRILYATEQDICPEALPRILLLPEAPGVRCPLVQADTPAPLATSTPRRDPEGRGNGIRFSQATTPGSLEYGEERRVAKERSQRTTYHSVAEGAPTPTPRVGAGQ